MSVRVLHDPDEAMSIIYDSVTGTAFGITMYAEQDEVYEWLDTLPKDARLMSHADLEDSWHSHVGDLA